MLYQHQNKKRGRERTFPLQEEKFPSTEGIHRHAISSLLKPAVTCLNDNHSRLLVHNNFLYSYFLLFFERRQKAFQTKYSPLTSTSLSCTYFSMCNTNKHLKSTLSQRELDSGPIKLSF